MSSATVQVSHQPQARSSSVLPAGPARSAGQWRGVWDRPCAAHGLISYRYNNTYGYIMIGAKDDADALREAARSLNNGQPDPGRLERWNGTTYEAA